MPIQSQLGTILEDRRLIALVNEVAPPSDLFATQGENAFCPERAYDSDKIDFEIRFSDAGLMKAQHRDADIPLDEFPGIAKVELDAPVWRSKYILRESDLQQIRTPGQREGRYGQRIIADAAQYISNKAWRTKEWSAWQALAGTLTISYPDAVDVSVNYRMPTYLAPTASPLWSDTTNADPINDILTWCQRMRLMGATPGHLVFNSQTHQELMQNAKVRALIQAQYGDRMLASGMLPQGMIAGLPYTLMDQQYLIRAYVGTAYTSGTSLVLDDAREMSGLGSSDQLVVGPSTTTDYERAMEVIGVTSISGTTVTIDGAMTNDFSVGDPVTWRRPFLPDRRFAILPRADGEKWMEWWTCPSVAWNSGNAGVYAYSERMQGSPLRWEIMGGVDGMPVMFRQMRHVWATV